MASRTRRIAALLACAIVAVVQRHTDTAGTLSLLFSPPNTSGAPASMTTDAQGFIYLAGRTSGVAVSVYVTKLTPSRTVIYTRVFTVSRFTGEPGDCSLDVAAVAAQRAGAPYPPGGTRWIVFPLARPFRTPPRGSPSGGSVLKRGAGGGVLYPPSFGSGGKRKTTGVSASQRL